MRAYSIFDDYTDEAIEILTKSGIDVTIHPMGTPRPNRSQMKAILEEFDCVIIGTSQKIDEGMFDHISSPKIIASASVGLDHITVPSSKRDLVTIINTPKANAQSVAEYTIGCALACCKRLEEGKRLYSEGKNNKSLIQKPNDLSGKTLGVIGAGFISEMIMKYASFFGMNILCWTKHPENHLQLEKLGVKFVSLNKLAEEADVISVNLPDNSGTRGIISKDLISLMKENSIFISVSRANSVDIKALFEKARTNKTFYVCLDLDVNEAIVSQLSMDDNVMITPHIAGGTVESRYRMFKELAVSIADI